MSIFASMSPIVSNVPVGEHTATIVRFDSITYTNKEGVVTEGCNIILKIGNMECKDFRSTIKSMEFACSEIQSQLQLMTSDPMEWEQLALGKELIVYCTPQLNKETGKVNNNINYKPVTATFAPTTPAEPVRKSRPTAGSGK